MTNNEPHNAYNRLGTIARFKPLHNGAAPMLDVLCTYAKHAVIGIGSSNKHDLRNPFSASETRAMLEAYLQPRYSNYSIIEIPDFAQQPEYADGTRWRDRVIDAFGELDGFLTANPFVEKLLSEKYPIIKSWIFVPPERRSRLRATEVRYEMALGDGWKRLVPPEVASYITENGLDERFRKEFGLRTIAQIGQMDIDALRSRESEEMEHQHAREAEVIVG